MGNDNDCNEELKSPSGANSEKGDDEVDNIVLGNLMPTVERPPPTIKD